jgi:hypothetical protein
MVPTIDPNVFPLFDTHAHFHGLMHKLLQFFHIMDNSMVEKELPQDKSLKNDLERTTLVVRPRTTVALAHTWREFDSLAAY